MLQESTCASSARRRIDEIQNDFGLSGIEKQLVVVLIRRQDTGLRRH